MHTLMLRKRLKESCYCTPYDKYELEKQSKKASQHGKKIVIRLGRERRDMSESKLCSIASGRESMHLFFFTFFVGKAWSWSCVKLVSELKQFSGKPSLTSPSALPGAEDLNHSPSDVTHLDVGSMFRWHMNEVETQPGKLQGQQRHWLFPDIFLKLVLTTKSFRSF